MKKYYLFISLAALIGLSSCASLRIDKRQHNKGWYVDFGTEKKAESTTVNEEQEVASVPQKVELPELSSSEASVESEVPAEQPIILSGVPSMSTSTRDESPAPGTHSDSGTSTTTSKGENANPNNNPSEVSQGSDDQVLLVILAIFIPPLAVYMVQGITPIFWITLICFLFGGVFLFGRFGYGYLGGLGLVAIILALLVVFGKL